MQLRCSAPNSETDGGRRERRYGRKEDAEFDGVPQQICAQRGSGAVGVSHGICNKRLGMSPWRWLELGISQSRAKSKSAGWGDRIGDVMGEGRRIPFFPGNLGFVKALACAP